MKWKSLSIQMDLATAINGFGWCGPVCWQKCLNSCKSIRLNQKPHFLFRKSLFNDTLLPAEDFLFRRSMYQWGLTWIDNEVILSRRSSLFHSRRKEKRKETDIEMTTLAYHTAMCKYKSIRLFLVELINFVIILNMFWLRFVLNSAKKKR